MNPTLLAMTLVASLALPGVARAQDAGADPAAAVRECLAAADAVRRHGRKAAVQCRRAAKKNRDLEFVLHELKRQARRTKATGEAKADELKQLVEAFIAKARPIVEMGPAATERLDALAAAEKDANAARLIRELAKAWYIQRARRAIEPFRGKGSYPGMYDALRDHQSRMRDAFLTIFLNQDDGNDVRGLAAEGVAQFASKGDEAVLKELRAVADDVADSPAARDAARKVLARLGDRKPLDDHLKEMIDRVEQERKKEQPNLGLMLSLLNQIAFTYQTIGEYKPAVHYFMQFANLAVQLDVARLPQEYKALCANAFYNLACAASRLEVAEVALFGLNEHFNFGGTIYEWARQDGDLAWLRKDERFEQSLTRWQKAELKPGSYKPNMEELTAGLRRIFPPAKEGEGKAKEKPESRPAGGEKEAKEKPKSRPSGAPDHGGTQADSGA